MNVDRPPEEVRKLVLAYLDGLGEAERTARMREVLVKYMGGVSLEGVMEATGCIRGIERRRLF